MKQTTYVNYLIHCAITSRRKKTYIAMVETIKITEERTNEIVTKTILGEDGIKSKQPQFIAS